MRSEPDNRSAARPPAAVQCPAPGSAAPEGRQNVAHGVSRGNRGATLSRIPPRPSPGGATERPSINSVAPAGLRNGGKGDHAATFPRLTPWATFCRPSGAEMKYAAAALALVVLAVLLTGCT